jgi:hypothetical protein
MIHLSPELLRRYRDEPAALLALEKEHLLACASCRRSYEEIGENASFADGALLLPPVPLDVEGARRAVALRAGSPVAARFGPRTLRFGWLTGVAAAAVLALGLGFTPLRSTAANFLAVFEPHTFAPIAVTRGDLEALRGLPELSAFGSSQIGGPASQVATFGDTQSAARFLHRNVLQPHYLPTRFDAGVHVRVTSARSGSFTFQAAKARASAARNHAVLPPMPAGIDGSTLYATLGPVVLAVYGDLPAYSPALGSMKPGASRFRARLLSRSSNLPSSTLAVVQAPAPRVYSSGASVSEIVAYLLAQPGMPADLAAQIRAIGDPSTTLPIPIVLDRSVAQRVPVQGVQGLAIGDETGVGSAVIWQRAGMVYAVTGPLSESELLAVANSLAP